MRLAHRLVLLSFAALLGAVGVFATWRLVWVPWRAMRLVGVTGPWVWSGRARQRPHSQAWIDCTQATTDASLGLLDVKWVVLNRYTGALNDASHQWIVADSAQWRAAQDSVRRAMRLRGGKAISCENLDRIGTERRTNYAERYPGRPVPFIEDKVWHFAVADVHLQAIGLPAFPTQRPNWHIEVTAYGDGVPECHAERHRVRLLTPPEWLAREREALAEELGF